MGTPLFRGQGNESFRTADPRSAAKRGQIVPYNVNGAPTVSDEPGWLAININDMPSAAPADPLYEFEVGDGGLVFSGLDQISAGVAATSPSVFRLFKNGAANGSITFTGSSGTASFSDSTYAAGDLFALYPPLSIDATLDRVRITLGTD